MKVRFTCPVHGTFEVRPDEVVIAVFDVHLRCGSGCAITKKVNPVLARRLRANGAEEVGSTLAREAREYLDERSVKPYRVTQPRAVRADRGEFNAPAAGN